MKKTTTNEVAAQPAGSVQVFQCGPKERCPDGSEHDYSEWREVEFMGGVAESVVCSKCGHAAIDDAMWM